MNYKEETQLKYKKIVDRLCQDLPPFCKTFFIGKSRLSEVTAGSYAYNFSIFFNYLHDNNSYFREKPVTKITLSDLELLTTDDIEEFLHWLRYHTDESGRVYKNSSHTIEHYCSALSSLWDFNIKRKHLVYNPVSAVERAKKNLKKPIYLEDDEKDRFMAAVSYGTGLTKHQQAFHEKNMLRDTAIFTLFLDTGMRISELVGINVKDLNFEKHYATIIRKGGGQRDIYFSDHTQEVLTDYLAVREQYHPEDGENALFLNKSGKRLSERSIQLMVKKYINVSNPERTDVMTPHKLRATFATNILKKTGDIELASELLDHRNLQTTKIYAQYDAKKRESVRNLLQNEDGNN